MANYMLILSSMFQVKLSALLMDLIFKVIAWHNLKYSWMDTRARVQKDERTDEQTS